MPPKLQIKHIEIITPNIPALKKKKRKKISKWKINLIRVAENRTWGFKYTQTLKTFNKKPSECFLILHSRSHVL